MDKAKNIWKSLNKRNLFVGIAAIAIIVILVMIIVNLILGSKKTLTCTLSNDDLSGFTIKDEIKITLKKNKVYSFDVSKSVELEELYSRHEAYFTILENSLNNAFEYVGKDNYKLTKTDNKVNLKTTILEKGVIFNNLEITLNNPESKYDLKFNTINNIESAEQVLLIGDEYKLKDLEKKVEGYGYTCE